MPAEWEKHFATCLAWPHCRGDWPGKFRRIPPVFAEILRHLSESERVFLLINTFDDQTRIKKYLHEKGVRQDHIIPLICPTNRAWLRDSGPTMVTNGTQLLALLWQFNAWGEKYTHFNHDAEVGKKIAEFRGTDQKIVMLKDKRVVLEGGAIDVDGQGNLIATEECLLSTSAQMRNPCISRHDLEEILKTNFDVKLITWLAKGIPGDDTHGHVDDVARFTPSGKVLLAADPGSYAMNLERLLDANLDVQKVPMPDPPIMYKKQLLPASYLNFYISNTKVLVPIFRRDTDDWALEVISAQFPGRTTVGIDCTDLVWGLGAIHCLTQQIPEV